MFDLWAFLDAAAGLEADALLERAELDVPGVEFERAAYACLAARFRILDLHGDRPRATVDETRAGQITAALAPLKNLRGHGSLVEWAAAEGLAPLLSDQWHLACTGMTFATPAAESFCRRLVGRTLIDVDVVGEDPWAAAEPTFAWLITDEPRALTLDASWSPDMGERDLSAALGLKVLGPLDPYGPVRHVGHRLEGLTVVSAAAGTDPVDGSVDLAEETELIDRVRVEFNDGTVVCFDADDGPGPCLAFGDHGGPLDPEQRRKAPTHAPVPAPALVPRPPSQPEPDDLPF